MLSMVSHALCLGINILFYTDLDPFHEGELVKVSKCSIHFNDFILRV